MTETWTTEETGEVSVYVNNRFIKTEVSVSPQMVKDIANEHQIRKFTVSGDNNSALSTSDFPVVCGSIHIDEYNEAK